MAKWTNEAEAREEIKSLVGEYYKEFSKQYILGWSISWNDGCYD